MTTNGTVGHNNRPRYNEILRFRAISRSEKAKNGHHGNQGEQPARDYLVSIKLPGNPKGCPERNSIPKANKEKNAESRMSVRYCTRPRDVLVMFPLPLRYNAFQLPMTLLTMPSPNKHAKEHIHILKLNPSMTSCVANPIPTRPTFSTPLTSWRAECIYYTDRRKSETLVKIE